METVYTSNRTGSLRGLMGGRALSGLRAVAPNNALDHSLVPRVAELVAEDSAAHTALYKLVSLSSLSTYEQALVYASTGFHASVDRGLAATGPERNLWSVAASLYASAFTEASASTPMPTLKSTLTSANRAADTAKAFQPPAGTVAKTTTTAGSVAQGALPADSTGWSFGAKAAGVGAVGLLLVWLATRKKKRG